MTGCRRALITIAAVCLMMPAAAVARPAAGKHPAKITVHPKRHWRGYGFLPGYRPWVNNLDRRGRSARVAHAEPRYLDWYTGRWNYGWGDPRFYRGRWNGGSFGPCWTYTPIGMMPTCGP